LTESGAPQNCYCAFIVRRAETPQVPLGKVLDPWELWGQEFSWQQINSPAIGVLSKDATERNPCSNLGQLFVAQTLCEGRK